MKISKILLVLFVAVSILSCKKDDGSREPFEFEQYQYCRILHVSTYLEFEVETHKCSRGNAVRTTSTTADTYEVDVVFASQRNIYLAGGVLRATPLLTGWYQTS